MIEKNNVIFNMNSENSPVGSYKSGDIIEFETMDCFSESIKNKEDLLSEINWECVNPATGPIFIEGAEEGDVLKVEILDIEINDRGVVIAFPGAGALGDKIKKEENIIVEIKDGKGYFEDMEIDLNPMIGVIGTSPKKDKISTGTPFNHGGNMDCKMIKKGVTLYLPVNVKGALLAMGDLHAAMGDGEIMGSGVEISGKVKVKVEVKKDFKYSTPLIETEDKLITIASRDTMEEASKVAIENMAEIIMDKKNTSLNKAGMLMSILGDLKVCQIVDPKMTMRMEFEKRYL